jgi:hypothetical protein
MQNPNVLNCVLDGQWIGKGIAYGLQRDRHTPTNLEQPTMQEYTKICS